MELSLASFLSARQLTRDCGPADLAFVLSLAKRFSNELGFLPREAVATYIARGQVLLGVENEDHAGFIVWRPRVAGAPGFASIVQAAVCMDAQRRHLGLVMVEEIARRCVGVAHGVQAWCAADLEANAFWRAASFQSMAVRHPHNARGRRMILWRRALTPYGARLALIPPARAGWKAKLVLASSLLPVDITGPMAVRPPRPLTAVD